jgi:hypothetical protein
MSFRFISNHRQIFFFDCELFEKYFSQVSIVIIWQSIYSGPRIDWQIKGTLFSF